MIYSTTTVDKISLSIQSQFLIDFNLTFELLELKTSTNWGICKFSSGSPHDFSLGTETIRDFSILFEIMIALSVSMHCIKLRNFYIILM